MKRIIVKQVLTMKNLLESAKRLFQNNIREKKNYIKMGHKIKIRNIGHWSLLASYLGNNKGYEFIFFMIVIKFSLCSMLTNFVQVFKI
jgi:hypothetical protein